MARKDEIFMSFLEHPIIKDKYGINESSLPTNLRAGLSSDHVIVKAIALIVESQEKNHSESDIALQRKLIQFLNQEAI